MFDYATHPGRRQRALLPAVISGVAHTAVLVIVAISALSAAEVLPPPPDMMAFVVSPAPPPPPPPEARIAEPPPPKKPARTPVRRPTVPKPIPAPAPAAPVEAPTGIAPETGLEQASPSIEPGFENGVPGGVAGGIPGGTGVSAVDAPTPPPPPRPVRVGGDISTPRLVERVNPEYPEIAMQAQIEGVVILEAVVDGRGRVESVKVLRGQPLLNDAAVAAVRDWRYQPLRLNGQPTPFVLTVTVSFSLG
jgi:protein TonB